MSGPEAPGTLLDHSPLPALDGGHLRLADVSHAHDLGVEDDDALLPHRAHRELGLEGHAELAYDDHVEGSVQRLGHLVGHG